MSSFVLGDYRFKQTREEKSTNQLDEDVAPLLDRGTEQRSLKNYNTMPCRLLLSCTLNHIGYTFSS